MEVWNGFVFVRFKPGPQRSVATLFAPFAEEASHYRMAELRPTTRFWHARTAVNWKSVRDVDNEGYHVAMAHPALQDLYGRSYADEPFVDGVSRSFAPFNAGPGRRWSVRHYKAVLPEVEHLPPSHRRAWMYYGLFPNAVFTFTPGTVGFYQEFPIGIGLTQLRGAVYTLPAEDRRRRLSRYLVERIDRDTAAEDAMLTIWSSEATQSSAYDGVILSDYEYGVKTYHDALRKILPALTLPAPPVAGTLAEVNAAMRKEEAATTTSSGSL
jgi:phenylpropionate dioxygenase-like ring-hydroxylating dioxygenase large terminal subunit